MIEKYYQMIVGHYGDQVAIRSQVPLINHIDEGVAILKAIGSDDYTIAAYMIHPLMQNDEDLQRFVNSEWPEKIHPRIMLYAMEYRKSANAYLCRPNTDHYTADDSPEITLAQVKHMLIADKVQNRKDFEAYHLGHHARSVQLHAYFKNWLAALGVSEMQYQELTKLL